MRYAAFSRKSCPIESAILVCGKKFKKKLTMCMRGINNIKWRLCTYRTLYNMKYLINHNNHRHQSLDCFNLWAEETDNLFRDDLLTVDLMSSGTSVHTLMMSDQCLTCPRLRPPSTVDGLVEAVMLCDVAKPWYLTKLNGGEEWFLSAHKTSDITLHIIIGFVIAVRVVEKISQAGILS